MKRLRQFRRATRRLGSSAGIAVLLCGTAIGAVPGGPAPGAGAAPAPDARAGALAASSAAAEVTLTIAGGFPLVPVRVNGQGPFLFVLDTGAETTVLSTALAGRLGLVPRARYLVDTVVGSTLALAGRVDRLSIGPLGWAGQEILWMPLAVVQAADPRIEGVVGLDLLGPLDVLLDYRRARLTILPPEQADLRLIGTRTPVTRVDGRYAVTASAGQAAATVSLILDSGAGALVLFDSTRARALRDVARRLDGVVVLGGHAGARPAARLELPALRVAGVTLSNVVLVDVRTPAGVRVEDGLLPTRLFDRVYFAASRGYVMLDPSFR